MNKKPLITVVTCTYNRPTYLEKCLHSIESQTYKNIEHIINDGYSTDEETLSIIKKYIERNKNKYPIIFMKSKPKGIANALNVATMKATGDIIQYLHDDDYYINKGVLKKIASYFEKNPDLVWVTGDLPIEYRNKLIKIPITRLFELNPRKTIETMICISHENTFVKTWAVKKYGLFVEENKRAIEYRLWIRMIKDHLPLIKHEYYTVFIIHPGSASSGSILNFAKGSLEIFKTQLAEKIIPIIGYYEDKKVYQMLKTISLKFDLIRKIISLDNNHISNGKLNETINKVFKEKNTRNKS